MSEILMSEILFVTQVFFDHDACFTIQTEPNKNYMNQKNYTKRCLNAKISKKI